MNSKQDIREDPITEELLQQLKHDTVAFPPSGEKASVGGEADSDAPPVSSKELDASEGDENDASVFPPSGAKSGGSGE